MAGAYAFLDGGYSSPYMPYYMSYGAYPDAYQTYQNTNPYLYQKNNDYYYWPTYAPGYGILRP
jgi:hypothetical protein